MKLDCKPYEAKMKKTLDSYAYTLSTLRAGRATPDVLSPIKFEYYGSPTPINTMADIRLADARTLVIKPYDASTLKLMEKAILASVQSCPVCGGMKQAHHVCPQCGTYNGRKVLSVSAK